MGGKQGTLVYGDVVMVLEGLPEHSEAAYVLLNTQKVRQRPGTITEYNGHINSGGKTPRSTKQRYELRKAKNDVENEFADGEVGMVLESLPKP